MNGFSFSLKAASSGKKFKLNMVSDELIRAEIPMQNIIITKLTFQRGRKTNAPNADFVIMFWW